MQLSLEIQIPEINVQVTMRLTLLAVAACTLLPLCVRAQADDGAYCTELSTLVVRYVAPPYDKGAAPDIEIANATNDCRNGNFARAIPVLERKLRNNGFSLPKR